MTAFGIADLIQLRDSLREEVLRLERFLQILRCDYCDEGMAFLEHGGSTHTSGRGIHINSYCGIYGCFRCGHADIRL